MLLKKNNDCKNEHAKFVVMPAFFHCRKTMIISPLTKKPEDCNRSGEL